MAFSITLATVVVAALLVGLAIHRAQRDAPHLFGQAEEEEERARLTVDDSGLRVRDVDGSFRELLWSDVGCLVLKPGGGGRVGPARLVWRFESASGGPPLVVPAGADGVENLLAAVPHRLPGFDYRTAIDTMKTGEVAELEAWTRSKE